MVTSVDNVVLVFTARGVQRVQAQINRLAASAGNADKAVVGLGGSLNALGALLAVGQVVRYADSFTELQNRLRLVTDGSEELAVATQNIFDIASRTRASVEETSRTYFRFARANERLGLSEKELLGITETINQAVAISGTNAQSAASALFQFSQGIASGTLRGQELNSVLEQIPGLAELIAAGLGKGVDELRALGEAGELTPQQIVEALQNQAGPAAEQFGRIIFTVGQEFTRLETEIVRYIGEVDKATGASRALAEAIAFVADNIDLLVKGLGVVGALLARAFAPKIIAAARALGIALLANPIGAVIAAVGTLVTVLVGFREEITVIKETGATLGTVLEVVFGRIRDLGVEAFDKAKMAATSFFERLSGQTPTEAFNRLSTTITEGLNNNTSTIRQWANIALGFLTLPVRGAIAVWQGLPDALGDILFTALEALRQVVTGQFDFEGFFTGLARFIGEAFSSAFDFVVEKGAAAFEAIKNLDFEIPDIEFPDIDFSLLQDPIENRFEGGLERFGNGLQQVIEDTFNRDFVGETAVIVEDIKTRIIQPLIAEINAAQAAKDALGAGEPLRPPSDVAPQIPNDRTSLDKNTVDEINRLTQRFTDQSDKLREARNQLILYRDEVEKFPNSFEVSVEEVDRAIQNLENRIAGTVDLIPALFEGAAEAARTALVDFLIDPLNTSFKDLARSAVESLQRIVAEAIAAQIKLAALNFLQGFVSFQIPGATRSPIPGSQFGQDAIGGAPRLVGEAGPEIIIPASRSNVISTDKLVGGSDEAIQAEIRALASAIASMETPTLVNVNEQDPEAIVSGLDTRRGIKKQRNRVTADQRQFRRTLGLG